MINAGLEVISAGANVPFADKEIFFGPIADFTDDRIALIPDFISNCGMARVFAYLMEGEGELTDEAIFQDSSDVILKAMQKVREKNPEKQRLAKTAFEIALKQLV